MNPIDPNAEWVEADGLGGFASGTVSGIRSRRYHALLLTATTPPAGRMALVNGFDAWVETPDGAVSLSSQRYGPNVIHPDGATRIESFESEQNGERVTFRSYDGVPAVIVYSNGHYAHQSAWYRNFLYSEEQARGLDAVEDLASPGVFEFSLSYKPAVLMLAAEGHAITDIESIEARHDQVS